MSEAFASARVRLLRSLRDTWGWKASDVNLKVTHATSPDGRVRLWLKAQSIHFTVALDGKHEADAMKPLGTEMRGLKVPDLVQEALALVDREDLKT